MEGERARAARSESGRREEALLVIERGYRDENRTSGRRDMENAGLMPKG